MDQIDRRTILRVAAWGTFATELSTGTSRAQGSKKEKGRRSYRVAVIGSTGPGNYGHGWIWPFKTFNGPRLWRLPIPTNRAGRKRHLV